MPIKILMGYYDVKTVGDYINVLSHLLTSPRGDDYSDRVSELATLASKAVIRSSKHQLTSAGHTAYKLNFQELISGAHRESLLPVILAEPGTYDLGPNIHVSKSNHLEDKFAA